MNKTKKILIISAAAVFVAAALIVALVFALGGKDEAPESKPRSLEGCWVVPALYQNDTPTFVNDQFMIFEDNQASMYKDGSETPFASGSFSINEANQLLLPDLSKEYKIQWKSDNVVRLYENATTYTLLVKISDKSTLLPSGSAISGKWNVALKGDQLNNGEVLEFENNTLKYYKSGESTPSVTAEFTLSDEGVLTAEQMGLATNCYAVSENTLVLVQNTGIVWELTK